MKIGWADSLMMGGWVMFGKVVCLVGGAWAPKNMILPLLLAITEPVKLHMHGLGAFVLDSVIGNITGSVVVSLQRCSRLQVP